VISRIIGMRGADLSAERKQGASTHEPDLDNASVGTSELINKLIIPFYNFFLINISPTTT